MIRNLTSLIPAVCLALLLTACGQPDEQQSGEPADDAGSQDSEYVERMAEEHADDSAAPSPAVELGEVAAQPVLTEEVSYGRLDGRRLHGYLAYPEAAHGGLPGVLVFHEWWGLNDNIRAMSEKLAAQGYVVLAVDLYEGKVAETPGEARELMQVALGNQERLNANIGKAYKFMDEEIGALSIAALGWCFGGSMAMNTALLYPDALDAAVIYYGHVTDVGTEQLAGLQMPILGLFGGQDRGIPVEGVERFRDHLKKLGKDASIVIYEGAGHAFANPTGQNYEPEAAEDAWARTLKFLDRTLNAAVNRNVLKEDELPIPPAGAPVDAPVDAPQGEEDEETTGN